MKTYIPLCLLALAVCVRAENTPPPADQLTTLDGEVFERVRIQRVEPDGITYRHSWGVKKIAFTNLPEEVRAEHGYDPERAVQYRTIQNQREREAWQAAQDRQRADRENERDTLHRGHLEAQQRRGVRETQERARQRQEWRDYDEAMRKYRTSQSSGRIYTRNDLGYYNRTTSTRPLQPQPPPFPRPPPVSPWGSE